MDTEDLRITHFENNLIPNLTKTVSLSRNEQVFIFN